jgi:hypothetical protein
MKSRSFNTWVKPALGLAIYVLCQQGYADSRTYAATTDFPIIDAGLAPYYSEAPARQSLAINAADESYRDIFARAEVVYDGNEGIHDVTIVALAELDGEADYRLLINGAVVGTASNPEVSIDYTVTRHTFEDINIPVGAVLGVESLANTNGLIPEGDGTAFARGRWTALELLETTLEAEPTIAAPVDIDLTLALSADKLSMHQNEAFQIDLTVSNSATSMTATQAEVLVSIPPLAVSLVSAEQCTETTLGLRCALPEITAGGNHTLPISLMSTDEILTLVVQASVSADQNDREQADNAASLTFIVNDPNAEPEPVEPIDPVINVQTGPSSSGGSGALSLFWILLLLPALHRGRC